MIPAISYTLPFFVLLLLFPTFGEIKGNFSKWGIKKEGKREENCMAFTFFLSIYHLFGRQHRGLTVDFVVVLVVVCCFFSRVQEGHVLYIQR